MAAASASASESIFDGNNLTASAMVTETFCGSVFSCASSLGLSFLIPSHCCGIIEQPPLLRGNRTHCLESYTVLNPPHHRCPDPLTATGHLSSSRG